MDGCEVGFYFEAQLDFTNKWSAFTKYVTRYDEK